jgi:hypothetical protein
LSGKGSLSLEWWTSGFVEWPRMCGKVPIIYDH